MAISGSGIPKAKSCKAHWFYKKRETADHKARKTYPYREVTLDEIYEVFADLYGQELSDACKALEIELEINLTFPNDEVIEAYQYALKQNKRYISFPICI